MMVLVGTGARILLSVTSSHHLCAFCSVVAVSKPQVDVVDLMIRPYIRSCYRADLWGV